MRADDVDRVIEISRSLNLCLWSPMSILLEIEKRDSVMLTLSDNGVVKGFAAGRMVDPHSHSMELFNIGVLPAVQGTGLAQALLDEFVRRSLCCGARKILLEVRVSNARAIRFYEKNGFVTLGRRPRFYSDPDEDGFTMQLVLEASRRQIELDKRRESRLPSG
ncbi:MAG: ribosomal protein S18-alanine N-acetyltransferase [Pyrinomonadaceae bacterium]